MFRELWKRYKHGWIFLYFIFYIPMFMYLERTVTEKYYIIHTKLDNYIPFCEYFIIPYLLWFVYIAMGMLYFFFTSVPDFYKFSIVLYVGMTVFLLVSALYPNGHYLRPSVYEQNNVFSMLVEWIHNTDTPTNILPSIHVYNSLAVHMAVAKSENLKKYKSIQMISLILAVSITLSTVFLKQHSVYDVITACLLAGVMYFVVYGKCSLLFSRIKTRFLSDIS